jgi:hypothetical protein
MTSTFSRDITYSRSPAAVRGVVAIVDPEEPTPGDLAIHEPEDVPGAGFCLHVAVGARCGEKQPEQDSAFTRTTPIAFPKFPAQRTMRTLTGPKVALRFGFKRRGWPLGGRAQAQKARRAPKGGDLGRAT